MRMNPYLTFNGDCEAAFTFYQRCLGGTIAMMLTHGDSPIANDVPPEWHKRIMHARLECGDLVLMGSDVPPDRYERPQGISVSLQVDDPTEAERLYHALSENGNVIMPLQATFWAARFGMFTDRFGTPWMINCEQRA
ncbi:MAG: VOC family protein [Candidatus Hydrogenedentota bacterium]